MADKSFPTGFTYRGTAKALDKILIWNSDTGEDDYTTVADFLGATAPGQDGANGVSMSWQGAYSSEAALIAAKGAVQAGWVYKNTTNGIGYVRNIANTTWGAIVQDGANGTSLSPQGTYATEAALISAKGAIQAGWIYKNSTDKKSYVRNVANDTWMDLAEDGASVITIGVGSHKEVDINFIAIQAFTYKTMDPVMFTEMEYENGAPTLSIPLNTPLDKYTQLVVTPTTLGGVKLKGILIAVEADVTPPTITAFTCDATSSSLTVNITAFTATDDRGVNGYIVTESAVAPLASDPGWSIAPPSTKTASGEGNKTFFAYAKDAAGNISNYASASCIITLPVTQDYLQFTFASKADATAFIGGDAEDVTKWNAFLGITFTSVTKVDTADFMLRGGSNLTIASQKFAHCTTLLKVVDWIGTIKHVATLAFWDCPNLSILYLSGCLDLGESAFEATGLQSADIPACQSIGFNAFKNSTALNAVYAPFCPTVADYAFNGCTGLLTIRLDNCTALGSSSGNNGVFNNIGQLGGAGNSISLTVAAVLATCQGGLPDQDIVTLQNWNSSMLPVNYV